jgi:glycosyltransferase involved in cell wall biosynthesis
VTRVLALQNQYPPHHLGGYELLCRDVMEHMVRGGHEVTVLTTTDRRPGVADPAGEREGKAPGGVRVWRDLPWWWDDHALTNPPAPRRLQQEVIAQRTLRRALRTIRPEVVSIWNMGAMSLGLLTTLARRRVPLVFVLCDDWMAYGPNLDAWGRALRRTGPRRLVGQALGAVGLPSRLPARAWPGTYLFMSERTREAAVRARGWELPESEIIGGGIDHRDFPVATTPIADRPWRWRLLFVGRVEHRKGVATAIRALLHLPDAATLQVLGPPSPLDWPDLEALVASNDLGARVTFDTVPRAELRRRYQDADVFLFPSEWEEPFGLVPLEAMACDTPVVATGVGGSADFLADGVNCVLFPPGDPEALAASVTQLAGDAARRRHLVEAGRRTAADNGIDAWAARVAGWHERAAARST